MGMSVRGLKVFYDFLTRTKKFMESDAAVKQLEWKPGQCPIEEDGENYAEEIWIELIEPVDRPNESEAVFRAFLDENVKEIYELILEDGLKSAAQSSHDRIKFNPKHRIRLLDRHPQSQQLRPERLPEEGSKLILRPNTWTIECQRRALQALQDEPKRAHRPLLRLFERLDHAKWEQVKPTAIKEENWMVLTDSTRDGTREQRRFVNIALGTPDFALLEGPPGSGKTTAICELILQLAKREKRVLLCGSTHIAVDNVLERLMDKENPHRDAVIPVRIGDRRLVSEKARPWQIDEFSKTERKRIQISLSRIKNRTPSQEELHRLLRQGNAAIERMVLDAANLVCGTTIGILQHPDIRARRKQRRRVDPNFDFLIIDEASKTPFQEFLVPALWAKRWIIVGDPKQLSPYVDDEAMAVNIEACLPNEAVRNACIDAFLAAKRYRPRVAAVATASKETKRAYLDQCKEHDVYIADADQENESDLWPASIVIGRSENLLKRADELPLDISDVRAPDDALPIVRRRAKAWMRSDPTYREQLKWASEVGWRSTRLYELRLSKKPKVETLRPNEHSSFAYSKKTNRRKDRERKSIAEKYEKDIEQLLPISQDGVVRKQVSKDIARVRRVALPSVLESLQNGFERDERQRRGSALSDGLPDWVLRQRHVLLRTQHRMHPEIAEFSRDRIYDGEALQTPRNMEQERLWSYPKYRYRAIWIDVPAKHNFRNNRNKAEAQHVVKELRHFDKWAAINRRRDGNGAWEVAVLTFYRGQEREIREHLRKWTNLRAMRHFYRGTKKQPYLTIELCTVDRFQGHEADFVLISFANRRSTSFLESPNRLNVALTRARYQRVAIGDRKAMARGGGVLRNFAEIERWELTIK